MRFYALHVYATTSDVAYDAIYILLWSQIEINIALITASAPALRPLFKRTFGSTKENSSYSPYAGSNSYVRSQRGNGILELQSYKGKCETVVKGDNGSNSSQEQLTRDLGGKTGIVKTTMMSVQTNNAGQGDDKIFDSRGSPVA
jgi:hypothetical protein